MCLSIENALLIRAELCHGSLSMNQLGDTEYRITETVTAIESVLGKWTSLVKDSEAALWESLLVREVFVTGGSDGEYDSLAIS